MSILNRRLLGTLFAMWITPLVFAHFTARYHVIVDTDGGADDLRAICLMLASPEIEIIGITTSGSAVRAKDAAENLVSVLDRFGHQGILVTDGSNPVEAGEAILHLIRTEEMPVDVVALGSLSNLHRAREIDPGLAGGIRRVYSSSSEIPGYPGIPFSHLAPGTPHMAFPAEMNVRLREISSRYAPVFSELLTADPDQQYTPAAGSDRILLYMLYPEYFSVEKSSDHSDDETVSAHIPFPLEQCVKEILESDREDKSIIFSRFPVDTGLFEPDVASITEKLIESHGLKEWKIVVLTNEFHEHLGIYAILGAKMGLRAREYFHVGIDELRVYSSAGSRPPVSCMNDGLQASTGGTLGHGTITLASGNVSPAARFEFKDRVVELRVKEELQQKIRNEVGYGVQTFGLDSPRYWEYIRELALKYWLELSRFDIFEIREIS